MSTDTAQQTDATALMFPDLVGTRVLFVGGGGSIGRTTAKLAQELGAVVVVADVNADQIDRARALVGDVETYVADAKDDAALAEALSAAEADHIVLSTGTPLFVHARDFELDTALEWISDRIAPVLAVGKWIGRNPGITRSFTIVSGFVPRRPAPGMALWSLVGPGVVGLAENLAVELAPTRVNVVGPAPMVDSEMLKNAVGSDEAHQTLIESLEKHNPARRAARLGDAARAVVYLMGDPLTSASFRQVDGGAHLTVGLGFEH